MNFEIIDFHTHPFEDVCNNICPHKPVMKDMSLKRTKEMYDRLGIGTICGSVIGGIREKHETVWGQLHERNDVALHLRELYGGFYVPGFHVHPAFIKESLSEMERMHREGVRLIGELVPYADDWNDYACEGFSELLDAAAEYGMVVNFHTMGSDDALDEMVAAHPNVTFVAAHPGEYPTLMRHLARAKNNKNYYIDVSGTGMFRCGALRRLVTECGVDRILFGSDFPACSPAMFLGGVLLEELLTDEEKKQVLAGNAKRLLKL